MQDGEPHHVDRPRLTETEVGLQWANRVGVVTLIIGVALAFATATDRGWIGPRTHLALAMVAAVVALAAGEVLWQREHVVIARGATGLGLALLYLVAWAASSLFGFMSTDDGFAMMAVTTGASGVLAPRYRAQAVAVLAGVGGLAAPVLMGVHQPELFVGYLALLQGGALVIARRHDWRVLAPIAALGTSGVFGWWLLAAVPASASVPATIGTLALYGELVTIVRRRWLWLLAQALASLAITAIWHDGTAAPPCLLALALAGLVTAHRNPRDVVATWTLACLVAAWCVAGIDDFACVSAAYALFAGYLARPSPRDVAYDRVIVAIAGATAYLAGAAFAIGVDDRAYLGLVAVALALSNLGLAYLVRHRAHERVVLLGIALSSFALAVPLELAGFTIAIAWGTVGAGLAWLSRRYHDGKLTAAAISMFGIAICALAIELPSLGHLGDVPVVNPSLLGFAVVATCLFAAAAWFEQRDHAITARISGHALALLGGMLEAAIIGTPDAYQGQSVAISIWLGLYGAGAVVFGVTRARIAERTFGLCLLGVVLTKLYGYDVWQLDRGVLISAFLVLGAALLAVSYVYSRRARVSRARMRES